MKLITILIALFLIVGFTVKTQLSNKNETKMRVAVWDTYVTKKDGAVMHFDIIAPENIRDTAVIHGYGREYLAKKGQAGQPLTSKECRFCHIETVRTPWQLEIDKKGYFIIEMENCK